MKPIRSLIVLMAAVVAVALSPLPAAATAVPIPEPGSLTLLASGIVAGVLGYRWIRRR